MSEDQQEDAKVALDRYAYEIKTPKYGGSKGYIIVDSHEITENGPGIIAYCHNREYAIRIVEALNKLQEAENG